MNQHILTIMEQLNIDGDCNVPLIDSHRAKEIADKYCQDLAAQGLIVDVDVDGDNLHITMHIKI